MEQVERQAVGAGAGEDLAAVTTGIVGLFP